jgi:hypothetical protein
MSKHSLRKSVESIRQRIHEHWQKIERESAKSVPDRNLVAYWRKEIAGLEKSLAKAEKRLRRG